MTLKTIRLKILAIVGGLGGTGLFLISFLDSSVLTFPVVNDLLLMGISLKNPRHMPYYALMATLGSVAGCVLLFFIARKGGHAFYHRRAGAHGHRVRAWVERNSFLSVLVGALLPPPTPFKIVVLAAGVFEVPLRTFALAVAIARVVRYFALGFLAIRYGEPAVRYVEDALLHPGRHWQALAALAAGILILAGASYLVSKFLMRRAPRQGTAGGA
jgi:membrane protein YqaA with SNARE-associated domain